MATETKVRFIDYLPAVFRQDEVEGVNFLGRFLRAFETVFEGIQQELDAIPDLFVLLVPRVLRAEARQGVDRLELDTAAGLCTGDVVHLRNPQANRVEFAVVREPPELGGRIVTLTGNLRFDHPEGTPVGVVRAPVTRTVLGLPAVPPPATALAEPPLSALSVADVAALELEVGDVVLIGEDEAVEYAQVRALLGPEITVAPFLQRAYPVGTPVRSTRRSFFTMPPPAYRHARERGQRFLPWLAGWVGLRLRQDLLRPEGLSDREWDQYQFEWNRRFVQEVVPVVPWRGTKSGLEVFLNTYLEGEGKAEVVDMPDPLQVGVRSTVGVDTVICGAAPYFFWVDVTVGPTRRDLRSWGGVDFLVLPPWIAPRPTADVLRQPGGLDALVRSMKTVVNEEKPAHTRYALRLQAHTMQVGRYSTVGEDTLLWTTPLVIQDQ